MAISLSYECFGKIFGFLKICRFGRLRFRIVFGLHLNKQQLYVPDFLIFFLVCALGFFLCFFQLGFSPFDNVFNWSSATVASENKRSEGTLL